MTEQTIDQTDTKQQAQFVIQRIYVKDSSFEAPNTPAVFQQEWQPELQLDITTQNTLLDPGVYEVVITVTATVKNKGATAFLVEVRQAGIFTIQGAPAEQLDHLLGSFCPNILFPYAREFITAQVTHGSFPQLVLAPVNFDALYLQQMGEKKLASEKEAETAH